ncbi:DUF2515 domain-containing protein [Bacillus lacus]|uniref:DUF2515 domain-containing protein n=1 Tax=Metabacillus lacus TaxID=1983721 RepID=A0A7X2LZG7_9BACI|nr:DUF2515 family protein [Metabacillus lacus]MRX72893.1 DUF2515 domain-containing protein [Metabacillus lacus]
MNLLKHIQSSFSKDEVMYSPLKKSEKKEVYSLLKASLKEADDQGLMKEHHKLVKVIAESTALHNRNNVTRTSAYLSYYLRNPEVHWAFLAHMVSRNGGWSMTDLQSGSISALLTKSEQTAFFHFLEKANALIFQDAYPQLLIYEKSKLLQKPLFSLLKCFSVSTFMKMNWEYFYQRRSSQLLTAALITNEQNLIQQVLLSTAQVKEMIFQNVKFSLQELMGFTNVFFPYSKEKPYYSLAGVEVKNFSSLSHRIHTGKVLYHILFFHPSVLSSSSQFARAVPHSGSRSDYWPHFYSKTKNQSKRIYSPSLVEAWPDVPHVYTVTSDWFCSVKDVAGFERLSRYKSCDITQDVLRECSILQFLSALSPSSM